MHARASMVQSMLHALHEHLHGLWQSGLSGLQSMKPHFAPASMLGTCEHRHCTSHRGICAQIVFLQRAL
jgi:hypothetical protein